MEGIRLHAGAGEDSSVVSHLAITETQGVHGSSFLSGSDREASVKTIQRMGLETGSRKRLKPLNLKKCFPKGYSQDKNKPLKSFIILGGLLLRLFGKHI